MSLAATSVAKTMTYRQIHELGRTRVIAALLTAGTSTLMLKRSGVDQSEETLRDAQGTLIQRLLRLTERFT